MVVSGGYKNLTFKFKYISRIFQVHHFSSTNISQVNIIANILKFTYVKYLKNTFKFSTLIGENFKIYLSRIYKNAFKFSTKFGENFEIYSFQMPKNAFKF